jgi:hypothetical protein
MFTFVTGRSIRTATVVLTMLAHSAGSSAIVLAHDEYCLLHRVKDIGDQRALVCERGGRLG